MERNEIASQDSRLFAKSEFGPASDLTVSTFAQRPDLLSKVFGPETESAVPEFMRHDPTDGLYYRDEALEFFREFGLVAVDPAEPERPVARAFSVPFAFHDGTEGREELPGGGWDTVIRWADTDRRAGRHRTAVSALEIMVAPPLQRRGISRLMLAAMRDNARRLGFVDLYAPLRPTEKHLEPLTPSPITSLASARTDCLTTRGYEPMSWLARGSSRWRRTAWSSAARSPNGRRGPVSPSAGAALQSCQARCRPSMSRSNRIMRSMSSRTYGYTTASSDLTVGSARARYCARQPRKRPPDNGGSPHPAADAMSAGA